MKEEVEADAMLQETKTEGQDRADRVGDKRRGATALGKGYTHEGNGYLAAWQSHLWCLLRVKLHKRATHCSNTTQSSGEWQLHWGINPSPDVEVSSNAAENNLHRSYSASPHEAQRERARIAKTRRSTSRRAVAEPKLRERNQHGEHRGACNEYGAHEFSRG